MSKLDKTLVLRAKLAIAYGHRRIEISPSCDSVPVIENLCSIMKELLDAIRESNR